MAYFIFAYHLLVVYLSCSRISLSLAQNLPLKAVNLGNWLVIEKWMKPSLFNGMPNDDLLDGAQIQLKSTKLQKYLCAENGGGSIVVANRASASGWETFRLWRVNENTYNLRVFNKQFVQKDRVTRVVAVNNVPGGWETFEIVRKPDDKYRVRIKASNGLFVQVKSDTEVAADYEGYGWEDSNPSVFIMTVKTDLHGEYQLTNGFGPDRARQVLQEHWNNFVTEQDFRFMSANGLNAVRIPVGWWIAYDPNPPKPFVGGSLQALDNAFNWAHHLSRTAAILTGENLFRPYHRSRRTSVSASSIVVSSSAHPVEPDPTNCPITSSGPRVNMLRGRKYGMKVIIDLHAVQGSQNGWEHSGTRDGYLEWGDSYISDTVRVIDFLAKRYAYHPAMIAIELMNEPWVDVNLDTLKRYYKEGYEAVRKYTSNAYVILSNRLGWPVDPKELFSFASGLHRVVVDVHFYNLYEDKFRNMNAQQNIDYIYNNRASDLGAVTTSNGPLTFVGEWSGDWYAKQEIDEDRKRFIKSQLEVYGRATFGWAYWSYRHDSTPIWNLKGLIENHFINL
ncbi:Glucan 1,3-beta-glucosidase 2 [Morus notabilis]|uniref:Glucan 1,3-beta-glucosidase 2 n=1 Tax=Morus notabilis TaxID=981085 RepID=W9QW02_9ROSA|nr:Glucan 1,3-beta-glucosidase 2 [Morus notabilis]